MFITIDSVYYILQESFLIRLKAIHEYGPIIHEFDPYFNFRATEYLYLHGWKRFITWFDYKVWYPLGRPVGTTIYPGMQITAVAIKNFILKDRMSLNDVWCFIPAWFGSLATFLLVY
jgi:dolichyl-diphosphooligosaccharide--protein glycosyltransferase